MAAISSTLLETIYELQKLPSLEQSGLGGGTNLALRYGHRTSTDIDLFFPQIIGKVGFAQIEKEVTELFGVRLSGLQYPCDIDDQFVFLRFFVMKKDGTVKVEIMQNMVMMFPFEVYDAIRMVSEYDIGLFKLMSAANRASEKDIYDLDYLTEKIPLPELHYMLVEKQKAYSDPKFHNIFDQDGEVSPVDDPLLLLKFDRKSKHGSGNRPSHSQNRVTVMEGHKSWISARSSWRTKVRRLFDQLGIDFPAIEPQ